MKRLFWVLLFAINLQGFAQEPQDVVRISTNLVQVDVVVTKDGKQVPDLKPEDFEILEDGRRQAITNFAFFSVKSPSLKPAPQPGTSPDVAASTPGWGAGLREGDFTEKKAKFV